MNMLKGKLRSQKSYSVLIGDLPLGGAGRFENGAVAIRVSDDYWLHILSDGDVAVEHKFSGWLPVMPLSPGSEIILTV
jgi:hypothetical protein